MNNIDHFAQLDELLCHGKGLWQLRPFEWSQLPWEESHPRLCRWLEALTEADVLALEQDAGSLSEALSVFIPESMHLYQLAQLPMISATADQLSADMLAEPLTRHIPGRKFQQIVAFADRIHNSELPFLEWCAGKGHLGRVLSARQKQPVDSVEWQAHLCEKGNRLASEHQLPIQFHQADVLKGEADSLLQTQQHAVALHACGELHLHLLRKTTERETAAISLSPCCYHLIESDTYQPLSVTARRSSLRLSKHDLQLPLQETVTAGQRVRDMRITEVRWRLGFDALQRQLRGVDAYLNLSSFRKSLLGETFESFCHWAADRKNIPLPPDIDYDYFEQLGEQRRKRVSKIELVRHLYRRPLEIWLILDRVMYLQEKGYDVELGEFCGKKITPRNILINARKAS